MVILMVMVMKDAAEQTHVAEGGCMKNGTLYQVHKYYSLLITT